MKWSLRIERLLKDTRGSAQSNMLSFAPTWFVVFGVFLMNVQLSRNYMQRDMVDHAAAVAADTAMKVMCADTQDYGAPMGEFAGGRAAAIKRSVDSTLKLASKHEDACKVTATPKGQTESGGREIEVEVNCEFPCEVPFAAQLMCSGGATSKHVTLVKKQTTVAMGCDMKDGV
jgi:hypothetical protein